MIAGLDVVSARRCFSTTAGPVCMEELTAGLVDALVGMSAKEITLRLQQIRRKTCRAESVVERKGCRECRRRHAGLNRLNERAAPGILVTVQRLAEELVYQK